uniref:L1 transposable element RRM domain-containing protein n=1 Tax=Molossus molossus TaxID=27622 RepID=A0A7J8FZ93_MOLMO|nr:hypothetical protein HJG59_008281 [Molossus molossus]
MQLSKLSEVEFRAMILRKLNSMSKDISTMSKDIETLKINQVEMKNDIAEIKNTLEGLTSRVEEAEDQISELEDTIENNQPSRKPKGKNKTQEDSLRELWDNWKRNNIRIIGVPKEQGNEQGLENIFEEIVTENFPNLVKKEGIQVQEAQRTPSKKNPNRPTPRHIVIKMPKIKDRERIPKAARDKQQVTYKGNSIRLSADFSTETGQKGVA